MQFTMGCYKNEHCVICGSHVSEFHNDGCELGAAYADIKDLRIVIKNFLKFLGVETITEGLAKLAAEHSVHLTLPCTCWKDENNLVHIDPDCRRHPQKRASG